MILNGDRADRVGGISVRLIRGDIGLGVYFLSIIKIVDLVLAGFHDNLAFDIIGLVEGSALLAIVI